MIGLTNTFRIFERGPHFPPAEQGRSKNRFDTSPILRAAGGRALPWA
ncbi:hypothetical protein Z950_841 [Sulfitobacter mediterraneus KCTC 32188]|nr:hypothetical protein Z950_841 [Sulfitobacter mediterraneus KCTC 32188]